MKRMAVAVVVGMALLFFGTGVLPAAESPLLVDVAWLKARLHGPDLRLVDMVDEAQNYRKGHVPGALHVGIDDVRIAVPAGGFRLPTEDEVARLLARLAIGPDTQVVIYDDTGGLNAARLFFTLDVFGHRKTAILDGGIPAWRRAGHPLSQEIPRLDRREYRPTIDSDRVASAEWVRDRLKDASVRLVDARSPAEYEGKDRRATRGGHIPGAVNIEWKENLKPDGTFKSPDELRAMYVARGVTPDKTVVTYCQTHHRAAHDYFVLRLLGYPRVVGYDRSWVEWGNRDDVPVER
jgi:thiosulfate/3-mercaptopyruvate sulfurtransferase